MAERFVFDNEHDFIEKLGEIRAKGVEPARIVTYTPVPVHDLTEKIGKRPSAQKWVTLTGALLGLLSGILLTVLTSIHYPLITGGKPVVSITPFIVIFFELTILFGGVISLLGFLALAGLPDFRAIADPQEKGSSFVIRVDDEGDTQ